MQAEMTPGDAIQHALTTRYRKTIWRPFLSAMRQYRMTKPGDHIAVCISGGKDSFLMAMCLKLLQRHSKIPFALSYLTMDPGFAPEKLSALKETAARLDLPLHIFETDIFRAIEGVKSPCHVCAAMRRGHLYHAARDLGCNKIALGHHLDDAAETVLLGMLYGGAFQAMLPKLNSRSFPGMQVIRPLYFLRESRILNWQRAFSIHSMTCACRVTQREDGGKRREMKQLLKELERINPNVVSNIVRSTTRVNLQTLLSWRQTQASPEQSVMDTLDYQADAQEKRPKH